MHCSVYERDVEGAARDDEEEKERKGWDEEERQGESLRAVKKKSAFFPRFPLR